MSVVTSYPGVYIEEDASPSISVNSMPTAVPVFIGTFSLVKGGAVTASQCIRVSNWLDFTSQFSFVPSLAVTITSTASSPPAATGKEAEGGAPGTSYTYAESVNTIPNAAFDVQSHFQNGGGPCYILPLLDAANQTELNALPGAIEKESDITLLCPVAGAPASASTILNTLLQSNKGYFFIASSSDGKATPGTQADQTAVYYPNFTTSYYSSRPADSVIKVSGYIDANHPKGTEVTSMDALKTANVDLYNKASADIDAQLATPVSLSPVAAMAGVYCSTDASRGVWKAPANVPVGGITGVTALVSDDQQGTMND